MKTIRNPLFWADVICPIFDELREGVPAVRVISDTRDSAGPEIELEVRVVRVGQTKIPKRITRAMLKEASR